jgi:hypothetical protein
MQKVNYTISHQSSREEVLAAVAKQGKLLKLAPPSLRSDPAVGLVAMQQDLEAFEYLDPALQEQVSVIVKHNFEALLNEADRCLNHRRVTPYFDPNRNEVDLRPHLIVLSGLAKNTPSKAGDTKSL